MGIWEFRPVGFHEVGSPFSKGARIEFLMFGYRV